jgi:hypothetical protein
MTEPMHLSLSSSSWRWPAAAALSATAAIHMTLVPEHLHEVPYAGALFIALSAAALAIAIVLSATDNAFVWLAAGAISLGALAAYLLSRSIGLPSMSDDVGDWANALGLAAVACETLTLVCWTARVGSRSAGAARGEHPTRPWEIPPM